MNKNGDLWNKVMTDEKYSPISIIQHTNKVKFKGYVFSVETQEWFGTSNDGSVNGTLGRMVETNVYLKSVKSPRSYESQAINEPIPLENRKERMNGKPENYAVLIHRLVKKEIEQKLKNNPRSYLASIENIVEDYRKKNF